MVGVVVAAKSPFGLCAARVDLCGPRTVCLHAAEPPCLASCFSVYHRLLSAAGAGYTIADT